MRRLLVLFLLIVIASIAYSKLDWWAFLADEGWAYILRYWTWQNTVWMLFGLITAVAYWAGAPRIKRTKIIMVLIFATFGLVLVSNVMDWMYFWYNQYALPPIEEKWTWMPQSWMLGFGQNWSTIQQVQWTAFWLLMIPIMWYVTLKYILPRYPD